MSGRQPLTAEAYLGAWPYVEVGNADGRAPTTTGDFTVLHSRPLYEAWNLVVSSCGVLVSTAGFMATLMGILRGDATIGFTLFLVLMLFAWVMGCVATVGGVVGAAKGLLYNRAFYPPLLLMSGAVPHLGGHTRFSYVHERKRRGAHREGFVLCQLVVATRWDPSGGDYEARPTFGVLWSSEVQVMPVPKGGAVSFEQEIDLPDHLPAGGPVASPGRRTSKENPREVVWYLRIREVSWPRSEYSYEFVLPVKPAPGRPSTEAALH